MDFLEFVTCMTIILVTGLLIFVWLETRNALITQDLAEKRRKSELASKAARARHEQDEPELGAWVGEIAQLAGFDVEKLFQDEIPPELAKLIPLAKGFIQGGGLKKLLGGGGPEASGGEEGSAI